MSPNELNILHYYVACDTKMEQGDLGLRVKNAFVHYIGHSG